MSPGTANEQCDAHRVHPDFLPHLASDVAKPLGAVNTHCLQTAVPEHAQHLRVLCKNQNGGLSENLERR